MALSALVTVALLLALSACATRIEPNTQEVESTANGDSAEEAAMSEPTYGSCTLGLAEGASHDEAIRAVLKAEGAFVVEQNINALMDLWMDGSYIKNAKNTVDNEDDDQVWKDIDAIRHRYVRTVFPGAPSEIQPADLQIEITGNSAVVIATTQIGTEISPSGDRWELTQQDGCWLIQSLAYNLEPN